MHLSNFKRFNVGKVQPTMVTIQFANRSFTYTNRVIKNILVKVDKFIFPIDFIILDMEEDREILIIFGRSFLEMDKAMIDVQRGEKIM
ncbi:hypothetical protein MA16_Dca012334 [Dendrobium catenatum]|uniref:Reverse transcriptase domain-containing protein n=1 Tax=Dendrobium catenatum TaxID=906689 RepID=A0A2I0WRD2_9ASPA|nr:hypothetical protein MA16_Dca012334 [Dendrobium catenatum]